MSLATAIMSGVALVAALLGLFLLSGQGGSEPAVVARRIAGTMALALGIFLAIFAFGLKGVRA